MKPALHHVDIITPDLRRSRSFYEDVLGMRLAGWFFREGLFEFLFLRDSRASSLFCLEFCGPPLLGWQQSMLEAQGSALDHLSMLAGDIDGWYQRLLEEGVPFLQPPEAVLGAREMYFRDPRRTILEILTPDDPGLTPRQRPEPAVRIDPAALALHHVTILAEDPQRLAGFYMEWFEFGRVPSPPGTAAGGIFLADTSELHTGAVTRPMLRIIRPDDLGAPDVRRPESRVGLHQIAFKTEELERAQHELQERDAHVQQVREPGGCSWLRLTDPYGIEIGVYSAACLPS